MTFADIIVNYTDLNNTSLINSQYLHSISSEIQFRGTYALIIRKRKWWFEFYQNPSPFPFLKSHLIGNVRASMGEKKMNLMCVNQSSALRDTAWKEKKNCFGNELLNGEQNDAFEENQPHRESFKGRESERERQRES